MYTRHKTRIKIAAALAFLVASGQRSVLALQAQSTQQKPAGQQQPAPPKPANNNDFPEDTSSVPVIPANGSAAAAAADDTPLPALPAAENDPVRSPDDADSANAFPSGAGSSSSSSSLAHVPIEDIEPSPDTPPANPTKAEKKARRVPGLFNRGKTPEEAKAETSESDLDVGNYYLSKHNWKGALSRFQSALVLDPENPDVYWGLAESQRNLHDFANARANYQKLLDYDPENKHAKEAKKLLKEPELANAKPSQHP